MRKIYFSFLLMTYGLFSINAQFEFQPINSTISDINSNNKIVLMCNASCGSYIRAYDMKGERIDLDVPSFNNNNSYYSIKKNEKGAFLIGGVHYQTDDVIGLESGSFVIKYNKDGQLEFSKDIKFIRGEDAGDLIFSFINNDHIALGIGNEKLLIINNKGLTVDSILLNSKIIDVSYLTETEFVILDENHNIFIIDQTNKILKTHTINSNIHSTINIHLTNINNQKILLHNNQEVIILNNIGSDSLIEKIMLNNVEIIDLIAKKNIVQILLDQNTIRTYNLDNNDVNELSLKQGVKNQYNNIVMIADNLYLSETYGSPYKKFTHIQLAKNRKAMNVSVNGINILEIIHDSVYVEPLKKYIPKADAKSKVTIFNNSKDTLRSIILTGFSRGINCTGRTESYKLNNFVIMPFKTGDLDVFIEM